MSTSYLLPLPAKLLSTGGTMRLSIAALGEIPVVLARAGDGGVRAFVARLEGEELALNRNPKTSEVKDGGGRRGTLAPVIASPALARAHVSKSSPSLRSTGSPGRASIPIRRSLTARDTRY